jgi:hypothetical protein
VALVEWVLRGKEEELLAIKSAWSQGGFIEPFTRIDSSNQRQETARRNCREGDDAEVAVGSRRQQGRKRGRGSTCLRLCGCKSVCVEKRFVG